jgi:hypothetical protein
MTSCSGRPRLSGFLLQRTVVAIVSTASFSRCATTEAVRPSPAILAVCSNLRNGREGQWGQILRFPTNHTGNRSAFRNELGG